MFPGGPVNTEILKIHLHFQIRTEISGWQSCEEEANRKLAINTALILFSDNIILVKLMCAEVRSKRRIWQRIPSISKARFYGPKMHNGYIYPWEWYAWDESLSPNLHILSAVWSHRAPDSSSYRHMTPAKWTGSLCMSPKLLCEHIHSYPAILAMDMHNNLIVATGKIHLVRSWRLLSFSVISIRVSYYMGHI